MENLILFTFLTHVSRLVHIIPKEKHVCLHQNVITCSTSEMTFLWAFHQRVCYTKEDLSGLQGTGLPSV